MEFLHTEFWGGTNRAALVTLDRQANVMLLDDVNFTAYQSGRSFRYYGGWTSSSPVRLRPPHHGRWHLVVDLGGTAGVLHASVRIVTLNTQLGLFEGIETD